MLFRLEENWVNGSNQFNAPGEKLLGVLSNGMLTGVCGLNIDPYDSQRRVGRIRHLYVGYEYRRQQTGSLLLSRLIEEADEWFDYLNTHAPQAAFHFYERAGFIPISDVERVTHRLYL